MIRPLTAMAVAGLLVPTLTFAAFSGRTEMNGISYSDYAGFEDKWKQITVRYRTDTGEQRFTWANDKAAKALAEGVTDYPDGAVFAKIGFATEDDPAFASSKVPSGAVRYQFMVRNKTKYADTGGWGYALFDGAKTTLDSDPKAQAQACYACHQLVNERGQVFSQPLKISAFTPRPPEIPAQRPDTGAVKFATVPYRQLPDLLRRQLPAGKAIRSVQGALKEHVFRGTIDEIRPSLIQEVRKSGMPAALIANDGRQFSVVYRDSENTNCAKDKRFKMVFSTHVANSANALAPYLVIAYQDLCL